MTELNKTYRKSSKNTAIALGLGGAAILASGFLVLQVNSLDRRYGRIEENFAYYTGELEAAQQQLAGAREQLRNLSDQKQSLSREVANAESSRQSAAQREEDAQARLELLQDEWTAVQSKLAEATIMIEDAQRIERETDQLLLQKNNLETELLDLEAEAKVQKKNQLELIASLDGTQSLVERLENRKAELQRDVDRLGPAVVDLRKQERRVDQLESDEDRLEKSLDDLNANISSTQTEFELKKEQAIATEENLRALQEQVATVEGDLDDLNAEITELVSKKGELVAYVAGEETRLSLMRKGLEAAQEAVNRAIAQRAEVVEAVDNVQEEFSTRNAQLTTLQAKIAKAEAELAELEVRRVEFTRLQAQVDQLNARHDSLKAVVPELEQQAQVARVNLGSLRTDAEVELGRVAEFKGQASSLAASIEGLRQQNDKLKIETRTAASAAEEAQAAFNNAQKEFLARSAQLSTLQSDIASAEEAIAELEVRRAEFNRLQSQVSQLQTRRTTLEGMLPDLEEQVQAARAKLSSLTIDAETELGRVAQLEGQRSALEAEIKGLQNRREDLVLEMKSADARTISARASLQNELAQLEEVDARLDARKMDLERLGQALEIAETQLSDTRMNLIKRQTVDPETVLHTTGSNSSGDPDLAQQPQSTE